MNSKTREEVMTATTASKSRTLSPDLERYQRYTLADVAGLCVTSESYLRMCLWAHFSESYRKRRGISLRRLRTLPLDGWEKFGGRWTITHDRLWRQLEALSRTKTVQ